MPFYLAQMTSANTKITTGGEPVSLAKTGLEQANKKPQGRRACGREGKGYSRRIRPEAQAATAIAHHSLAAW